MIPFGSNTTQLFIYPREVSVCIDVVGANFYSSTKHERIYTTPCLEYLMHRLLGLFSTRFGNRSRTWAQVNNYYGF